MAMTLKGKEKQTRPSLFRADFKAGFFFSGVSAHPIEEKQHGAGQETKEMTMNSYLKAER